MRDLVGDLGPWWDSGDPFALATVVRTWQSAPRPAGAAMAVGPDGAVAGSVSGGCVEGAVFELCGEVAASGTPVLQRFGISDDSAFAVGLSCGGVLDVFVTPVGKEAFPEFGAVLDDLRAGRPVAVATLIEGGRVGAHLVVRPDSAAGTLGLEQLDASVAADARAMLAQGSSGVTHYNEQGQPCPGDVGVFVASYAPRPRMIVFGAIDFAAAVARVGSFLGYRVTVCDARATFATERRFPEADEIVVDWPHRYLAATEVDDRTVVCVLTHDPKFDVPLLEVALRLPLAYVGAMGSRRTTADRNERLRERGLTEEELARLHAPIGLDLGGRTPEETAISVAAEIVAARWGGSRTQLRDTDVPIHR